MILFLLLMGIMGGAVSTEAAIVLGHGWMAGAIAYVVGGSVTVILSFLMFALGGSQKKNSPTERPRVHKLRRLTGSGRAQRVAKLRKS